MFDFFSCIQAYHGQDMEQHEGHLTVKAAKIHKCSFCDMQFTMRNNMTKHIKAKHLGIKQFVCLKCGQRFQWANQLRRHKQKPCENSKGQDSYEQFKVTHPLPENQKTLLPPEQKGQFPEK